MNAQAPGSAGTGGSGQAQGTDAVQGTGGRLTAGAAQGECSRNGMKMGRILPPTPPFYKTVGQLKGPLEAKESLDAKLRYNCEIFACTNFHLQITTKI